ncbi:hypothetical protein [Candidatus Williamhamiltonella defendens]|uniref:hypothetical protein n=1 Tax=Candidatus Williamhamiltonella defendens TaxID=138072 RepID=UPI0016512D5C|nr:hypothetical protein [Candidatus Hamiltonella defensa]
MSFYSLGLNSDILRSVLEHNYSFHTPIQRQAIPLILAKRDLMASAQIGIGKRPFLLT